MTPLEDDFALQNRIAIMTFDRLEQPSSRAAAVYVELGVTAKLEYAVERAGALSTAGLLTAAEFDAWAALREQMAEPADYLDFYLDGFTGDEIAVMSSEYRLLEIDEADDHEIDGSLRRMNANYAVDQGSSSGREMLVQIGERLSQLEHGAVPKHFD